MQWNQGLNTPETQLLMPEHQGWNKPQWYLLTQEQNCQTKLYPNLHKRTWQNQGWKKNKANISANWLSTNQCFPEAINSPVYHLQGCQDATNLMQEDINDSNENTPKSSTTQTRENTSTINNSSDTPNTKKYGKNWQLMNLANLHKEWPIESQTKQQTQTTSSQRTKYQKDRTKDVTYGSFSCDYKSNKEENGEHNSPQEETKSITPSTVKPQQQTWPS